MKRYLELAVFFVLLLVLTAGCAATSQRHDEVVAIVDGSPIYTDEIMYMLSIAHRREDLSKAEELNFSDYLQKAIDDSLIIGEARRMGLDKFPATQKAVQDFILRESVGMLHDEEVVSKISVSDEEILKSYMENFVKFDFIEFKDLNDANAALEQLKGGADFREVSLKYTSPEKHKNNIELVRHREGLQLEYKEALSEIKPGEHTGIITVRDKRGGHTGDITTNYTYYIIKLLNTSVEDRVFQDSLKNEIGLKLRKEKELGRDYVKKLREKAPVWIEEELLAEINSDIEKGDSEKWMRDNKPLAYVYEDVLSVEELFKMRSGMKKDSLKTPLIDSVNRWIDVKLVDHEALSRHYELTKELEAKVYNYTNQLLKNAFIRRVIVPDIVMADEKLIEYFNKNLDRFMRPATYKIQIIDFGTQEEAESALNDLKAGTDFAWMAKTKTEKELSDILWDEMEVPKKLSKDIEFMKPGDVSPVFQNDDKFSIIRLKEKSSATPRKFEDVVEQVKIKYFEEKRRELLNEYVEKLREGAQIIIYEDVIRKMQELFSK